MFLVIGGLSMMSHHYTLGNIKSRTVGDGQHGTARWATDKEIKQTYTFQPASPQCFFADCFRIAQRNPAARTMASTGSTDLLPQVILASAHPAASNISRALLLSSIW